MKTSELINKLVDSLKSYGDLPTNINFISWHCPSENGSFKAVHLSTTEISDIETDEDDEFIDINSYICNVGAVNERNIEEYIHTLFKQQAILIENQKKIIEKLKEE